jgi:hypothetical protein
VDPLEMICAADVMTEWPVETNETSCEPAPPLEVFAYKDETCRAVAEEMAMNGVTKMPVVDRKTGLVCGIIGAQELLTGRRRAVVRESERNRSFQLETQKEGSVGS